jgi:hypothetical protein
VPEFVGIVRATLARREICILYAEAFSPATADPNKIWPEMKDPTFRTMVQHQVPDGKFLPPDELDGWVYTAGA